MMLIFGHPAIPSPPFFCIQNLEEIQQSLARETICFCSTHDFKYHLSTHCRDEKIPYAVKIQNELELLFYANLKASYLLVETQGLAKACQTLVNDYLLDTKLLAIVSLEAFSTSPEILELAKIGVDGIIDSKILTKLYPKGTSCSTQL